MVIHYKIKLIFIFLLCSSLVFAHTVTLEDKSIEKIINERMALMQKIKSSSSKIYRLIASNEGSLGSQETVQTGLLLVVGEAGLGLRATSLEMVLALAMVRPD